METFPQVLDGLAADLTEAGVPATTDPTKVQVPGALVQLAGLNFDTLAGYDVEARVVLIAPDVDWPQAAEALADLLDQALTADLLNLNGRIEPATIPLPGTPGVPLPAVTVPVLLQITP